MEKCNNLHLRLAIDGGDDFKNFIILRNTPYSYKKSKGYMQIAKEQDEEKALFYEEYYYEEVKYYYEEFKLYFESNNYYLVMLELDDKIIGMAEIEVVSSDDEEYAILSIENFIIKKEFQRRGFGTQFFQKIESMAKTKNTRAIELLCLFPGARAFWKKQGLKSYFYVYFTKKYEKHENCLQSENFLIGVLLNYIIGK